MITNNFVVSTKQRQYLIDFLKMICIIFVVLDHSPAYQFSPSTTWLWGCSYWLSFAVPLFLLISGFTWTLSWVNKNDDNIGNWYKPRHFFRKFFRFIIPLFIAFLIIEITKISRSGAWDSSFFYNLMTGLIGGSGYFVVVIFQLLILFPLLFLIVKNFKHWSLVIFFVINLIAQYFKFVINIPPDVWKFFMIRYICFIGFGIYLAMNRNNEFKWSNYKITIPLAICFIFGLAFVSVVNFLPYDWQFIDDFWITAKVANMFGALYLCPIIYVVIKKCSLRHKAWGFIGKMTFSIYIADGITHSLINTMTLTPNIPLGTLYCFLIVFSIGIVFYYCVEFTSSLLINKLFKKKIKQDMTDKSMI